MCSVLLFNLLCELFLWRWCAVFYFSTYCANCFCLLNVESSVLLFNLLFQLFLFNGGGVQCFTFQLIVRIVFVYWMWQAVFYFSTYCFNCFCLMVVASSVLLFNLLFLLFLWRWCAVFYFSTYCANCFCLLNVASSVLLFNLLFQLFLFNGGGVQCFTFQLIVSIGFV